MLHVSPHIGTVLYAVTIFLSAFLLFQVQPLIGRFVLPWFGGSAAVWTACLMFFQVALLLGYLYAYALVRWLDARRQAMLHVALLLLSTMFLPLWPSARWKPYGTEEPTLRILLLLGATVGLPYMLLASTNPLLSTWVVRWRAASPAQAGRVYRLFALSNFGSMLALLSYVLLVEPRYTLSLQSVMWSGAYGIFLVSAALCAMRSAAFPDLPEPGDTAVCPPTTPHRQALWLSLSACGSLMLMATTHHVSQNIAPVPFLWVVMLSVYLLSFILCFEGHSLYQRWLFYPALLWALWKLSVYQRSDAVNSSIWTTIPIYVGALFIICMVCHGELARMRPPPRRLTAFYLMSSLGGALGGVFTGVVAPLMFPDYFELDVGMVLCPLLVLVVWLCESPFTIDVDGLRRRRGRTVGLACIWCFLSLALIWFTIRVAGNARQRLENPLVTRRNFYGVLLVTLSEGPDARLSLTNGTIIHGDQFIDPLRRRQPTTYYGIDSGVGRAIAETRRAGPQRVGVVGLGAGTIASYGRPGDLYRFYEINPMVVDLAKHTFWYTRDAPQRIQIVAGDARLNMEREVPQNYDVLAIDAFSSDAIPIHLLTREAFSQYFRHLAPHGILAIHVSNRYFNLAPVVRAAAQTFGRRAVEIDTIDDGALLASSWVVIGNDPHALDGPRFADGSPLNPQPVTGPFSWFGGDSDLWTDDYANVLRILQVETMATPVPSPSPDS